MIKFLFKGLLRDRSRSLFPILTVVAGVMLTVVLYSWMKCAEQNMIGSSARFMTGHVKIMSQAYAQEADQVPNDLAFIGTDVLTQDLKRDFTEMVWTPRIKFGGLLDVPDDQGETRDQGPVSGLAVDLFSESSPERELLNLDTAVIRGRIPENPGEILISENFSRRLGVVPGEAATLISSTMYGSMTMTNFTIAGTIKFGITALDRGAMLADISDIQAALDMQDAAGEILGFYKDFIYRNEAAELVVSGFNTEYKIEGDEFSPVMISLYNQNGMAQLMGMFTLFGGVIVIIFMVAMSIVLWNAGLMGSLRRYGEIGVRLAMGENKGHLYRTLLVESVMIGIIGTCIGTVLGAAIAYYLQVKGIDISSMMQSSSIMFTNVMRARVTPVSFVIGFIPGLAATILGTSISGIGIFKRQTSQLIKELEV